MTRTNGDLGRPQSLSRQLLQDTCAGRVPELKSMIPAKTWHLVTFSLQTWVVVLDYATGTLHPTHSGSQEVVFGSLSYSKMSAYPRLSRFSASLRLGPCTDTPCQRVRFGRPPRAKFVHAIAKVQIRSVLRLLRPDQSHLSYAPNGEERQKPQSLEIHCILHFTLKYRWDEERMTRIQNVTLSPYHSAIQALEASIDVYG